MRTLMVAGGTGLGNELPVLFEEKRDAGSFALIADRARPVRVHRARLATRLAAHDHPIQSAPTGFTAKLGAGDALAVRGLCNAASVRAAAEAMAVATVLAVSDLAATPTK